MMITFFCTHCGAKLQVEDQWCGKPVTCPNCQQIAIVPQPEMTVPVATEVPPEATNNIGEHSPVNPYESPILFQGNMLAVNTNDMLPVRVRALELFQNTWRLVFRFWRDFCLMGLVFLLLNGFVLGTMYLAGVGNVTSLDFGSDGKVMPPASVQHISGVWLGIGLFACLGGLGLTVMCYQYILHLLRTGERSLKYMIPRSFLPFFRIAFCCFLYFLITIGLYILLAMVIFFLVKGCTLLSESLRETLDSTYLTLVTTVSYCTAGLILLATCWSFIKVLIGCSFFMPFVIDRDNACMESISNSNKYAKANVLKYLIAVFLTFMPLSLLYLPAIVLLEYLPGSSNSFVLPQILQLFQNAIVCPLTLVLGANMYFLMTNQQHIFSKQIEPDEND